MAWAKRVEAQRAQSTVISSITEAKEFDKIKISKSAHKDSPRRSTQTRMPMMKTCQYCSSTHPPRQYLAYGKRSMKCSKIGHFRTVCKSMRIRAMNEVEQETLQDNTREDIEFMSIYSIQFYKKLLCVNYQFKNICR